MDKPTELGKNRTGIAMSPSDSKQMIEAAQRSKPSMTGDGEAIAKVRIEVAKGAPSIGSVPLPASLKGAVKTGVQMLKGDKPAVFIDKLGERAGFERMGVRLYEAFIAKYKACTDSTVNLDRLEQFRNQELAHFELAREAIDQLGADPTCATPSADLAGVASMGVLKVVADPRTSLPQALNAMLMAELTDNEAWPTLITMAEGMDQDEMAGRFRTALEEEVDHLEHVRRWIAEELASEAGIDVSPNQPSA